MAKYKKKPVEIEAVQLRWDNWGEMCDFAPIGSLEVNDEMCRGGYIDDDGLFTDDFPGKDAKMGLMIPTLEGNMVAAEGDYVIKGVKGEFYPCKPDIFNETYEKVE